MISKIGFGGSCHWCTEAIFRSLKGVINVDQGWIMSAEDGGFYSEAVLVSHNSDLIPLDILIAIHLHTHSCTAIHSMRSKYRSAVYFLNHTQADQATQIINRLQHDFVKPIITEVLEFKEFRLNTADYLNYYYANPEKPFCKNIVDPKLKDMIRRFASHVDMEKLKHL
jgi:peptide-methionine (S)-S-oxide reductase